MKHLSYSFKCFVPYTVFKKINFNLESPYERKSYIKTQAIIMNNIKPQSSVSERCPVASLTI